MRVFAGESLFQTMTNATIQMPDIHTNRNRLLGVSCFKHYTISFRRSKGGKVLELALKSVKYTGSPRTGGVGGWRVRVKKEKERLRKRKERRRKNRPYRRCSDVTSTTRAPMHHTKKAQSITATASSDCGILRERTSVVTRERILMRLRQQSIASIGFHSMECPQLSLRHRSSQ